MRSCTFLEYKFLYLPPAYVVRREGNVLTRVCPSIHLSVHGGVPISHNALQHFPECHGADTGGREGGTLPGPAGGGYPARSSQGGYPAGGVPCRGEYPAGGSTLLGGTLPGGYPARGVPCRGVGYPAGGGYPVRTTEVVVTTRRAVCLLRSRRRTFLFEKCFPSIYTHLRRSAPHSAHISFITVGCLHPSISISA